MRSFSALALSLSLVNLSVARVAHDPRPDIEERGTGNAVANWFNQLFRKDADVTIEQRQADPRVCAHDDYWNFVHNSSFGESFCRKYMDYPEVTEVNDFTPVR